LPKKQPELKLRLFFYWRACAKQAAEKRADDPFFRSLLRALPSPGMPGFTFA
jgi:hypothetical protein